MAQDNGHRIAQLPSHNLQVRVAQPGRAHTHPDVAGR